jgi:hypothetical protein
LLAGIVAALKTAKNEYWATEVEVQRLGVAAWIAFADGKSDEAPAQMRASADMDDASEKAAVRRAASCLRANCWAICCWRAATLRMRSLRTKPR